MSQMSVFLLGMIGALAPEIVRLYSIKSSGGESWSGFYIVISLLFACLGGVVALILPATTLWGAFYAGISTPTLISTAVKKGIEIKDTGLRGTDSRDSKATAPPSLRQFFRAL